MHPQRFVCPPCSREFPSSKELVFHHLANHTARTCKICCRNGSTEFGQDFCKACKDLLGGDPLRAQTARWQLIAQKEIELVQLKETSSQAIQALRKDFNEIKKDHWCEHGVPKKDPCEPCEKRYAASKRQTTNYVHIDL